MAPLSRLQPQDLAFKADEQLIVLDRKVKDGARPGRGAAAGSGELKLLPQEEGRDPNWWFAKNSAGKTGRIPGNYVTAYTGVSDTTDQASPRACRREELIIARF